MGNYFTDNDDIQFLFGHLDLAEIAAAHEAAESLCRAVERAGAASRATLP